MQIMFSVFKTMDEHLYSMFLADISDPFHWIVWYQYYNKSQLGVKHFQKKILSWLY